MKYAAIFFILLTSLYSLSYAKYKWKKKNKLPAIGTVLLAMVSVVLPFVVMFIRR